MKKIPPLVIVVVIFGGGYLLPKSNDPSDSAPRQIDVGMQMTVKDFITRNNLSMGPREQQGYVIDVDYLTDWMPIFFDDNWITLRFIEGAQSFELPPGRTLQITQRAGRIDGLAFRPFDQPRPLNEMHDYIANLIVTLEGKGWQPTLRIKIPSKSEDFDSTGKNLFAEMQSPSGSSLQMSLRDYGLAPKQESFILSFDPTHKSADESRTYLLEVTLSSSENEISYGDLIYPRRIYELGDVKKELPLRYWINDPDWTPQKAGMVPTTPEERANSESSKWKMPPK